MNSGAPVVRACYRAGDGALSELLDRVDNARLPLDAIGPAERPLKLYRAPSDQQGIGGAVRI
jgi:hypothetical protein